MFNKTVIYNLKYWLKNCVWDYVIHVDSFKMKYNIAECVFLEKRLEFNNFLFF